MLKRIILSLCVYLFLVSQAFCVSDSATVVVAQQTLGTGVDQVYLSEYLIGTVAASDTVYYKLPTKYAQGRLLYARATGVTGTDFDVIMGGIDEIAADDLYVFLHINVDKSYTPPTTKFPLPYVNKDTTTSGSYIWVRIVNLDAVVATGAISIVIIEEGK